jgi:transposase
LAISEIQKLYVIEKQIIDKPPDEKRRIRQARAGPILDKMRHWLDRSITQVPPRTALGRALTVEEQQRKRLGRSNYEYFHNHFTWESIVRLFLESVRP